MINSNLDSTAIPETDYATVLSKDQMDWLIVGGSYLFFRHHLVCPTIVCRPYPVFELCL